ncbi:hypothetical protein PHJA_001815800 [Phtheirospermum japonicum]|uniref:Nuclear RNA export factor SDE5 n=1 Tax=Phtheirospermum japonicum TaxID=374723 RepID=A0A830C7M4_9LAMI|nr:hypothetical protein PHJA_001815800 [Phtheirospermum japonicum]
MKVELAPSSSSYTDEDQKNLKQLLEAFGSVISLEDMASAYCEAGRDLELTAEKLCTMQTSDAGSSFPKPQENVENPTGSSSGYTSNNIPENDNRTTSKPKKCSASMGTVSGVIGKDYMKPTTQSDGLHQKSKPVIINSDEFLVSEIWDERKESTSSSRSESMDSDIQEFICKMLGDGFQLEKSVIQDVVGQCGYNMPMSIDKLIDLSAATLEKSDDVVGVSAGKAAKNSLDLESVSCRTKSPGVSFSGRSNSDGNRADGVMLPETGTKKKDVQREVLEALFSGPDRFEEREPIVPIRQSHRSVHGDESKEASYEELRRAVAEYWVIMKEYLKASLDAYTRKDYETAEKLQEEANFYNRKAPIPYLKAVVGTDDVDKKDARRKRLITKLLEKDGIPWTEEGNGWIISVRVDEIDPSKLSFANK